MMRDLARMNGPVPPILAAMLFAAATPAAAQTLPSAEDMGTALSLDRFSDECEPGTSCPPINIYYVIVRSAHCESMPVRATSNRYGTTPARAAMCRFEEATVTAGRRRKTGWLPGRSGFVYLRGVGWRVEEWVPSPQSKGLVRQPSPPFP